MNSKDNQKKKENKIKKSYFLYNFVKVTGALPALVWMKPKVICVGEGKGVKVKGGVMITSNHVSFFDPVLIHCVFWRRRLHILATKDLYSSRMKNFFFTRMHCILVDKQNFSMNSFHDVCDYLKAEKAVVIFPEGQVNKTGSEVLGFKSGAVLMAYKSGKPILPVYIIKKEKWYQRRVVLVGEPIDVRTLCGDNPSMADLQRASDLLRQKEVELLEYYNTRRKK